ncbi:fibrillin-2-like [Topomyia yanbarensis]|uniref:fibrillin-2-like n=1 Tax=Topomyia yanbarensis TaxID=2498891 RepID=UPI00273BD7F4|nr:fibrillin-2-like [Topomyia yanbarensis]
MWSVLRIVTVVLLMLMMNGYRALGKFCFESEKIPKLVQNKTKGVEYGVCNYYCMFSEHSFPVSVPTEKLTCSLEYEYRQKQVCCEGYHHYEGDCLPSCKHKCVFGECTAPETCSCYSGYQKVDDFRCEPICDMPCHNGRCVAPNSCLCDDGFEKNEYGICVEQCEKLCQFGWCVENQCHCYEGYVLDAGNDDRCVPQCDPKCRNGTCVLPNVCQCAAGYTLSATEQFTCQPVCSGSCQNCVAPETCLCEEGYQLNNLNQCVPQCERVNCTNGSCIGPEVCQCNEGYIDSETGCVPLCEAGCMNGNCVAPGVCVCDDLYRKGVYDTCEPYCPAGCPNGYCSAPGFCQCKVGYALNQQSGYCEPVCPRPCENAVCTGPHQCTCNEGYLLDRKDGFKCVPKCSKPCVHGKCVAPDVCECNKGYMKVDNSQNVCEAKCTNGCSNGKCVGPERCECLPGYFATISAINSKKSVCTPYCKNKCINAYCIKPNVCQCISGYRFADNSNSVCEPICDESWVDCSNGRCAQPNICECDEGYALAIRDGKMVCEPKPCERVCVNGVCVGNGSCVCSEGYRQSTKYDYICEPDCNDSCINGVCIAPNMCVCREGFATGIDGVCEPVCDATVVNCSNGVCLGNNQCQCLDGYHYKKDPTGVIECLPLCVSNCANGNCVAPGRCECDEGYRFNGLLEVCEPICDPQCEHGDCIEPNVCLCHDGFVPAVNHICVPHCDPHVVDCANGICGGHNFCRCNEGFFTNYMDNGIQTCLPVPVTSVLECQLPASNCNCSSVSPCPVGNYSTIVSINEPSATSIRPCPEAVCPTVPACECPTQAPCHQLPCPSTTTPPQCTPELPRSEASEYFHCDENYVDCSQGTCLGNNICECDTGYRKAVDEQDVVYCEPVCEIPCTNGMCVGPNLCECFAGYIDDGFGSCHPNCLEPCVNGECVAPNTCRCLAGYEEEWDGVCRKACLPRCIDGICVDGKCVCEEGWELSSNNVCSEMKENELVVEDIGEVVGVVQSRFSNNCEEGFEYSDESGECLPVCKGCRNGDCIAPDECECRQGFIRMFMDGVGSCQPDESVEEFTNEAELEELEGPKEVNVHSSAKFDLFSIFNRSHLIIGLLASSIALVIMLTSYWTCTYLKKEISFPTETMIN